MRKIGSFWTNFTTPHHNETNKMEKNISSWLKTLPLTHRRIALASFKAQKREGLKVDSLSKAIIWGFNWGKTPEGDRFWSSMHDHIVKIEALQDNYPRIPQKTK